MPALTLLAAVSLGTAVAAPAQESIDDTQVTRAVERELLYDVAVPATRLDVATADGIVTLDGTVSNLLAKERAVRLAETVKGVRSVVDLVEVSPDRPRTDDRIARDIERALLQDPATDSYEVTATVSRGHATLTGSVDSWAEKELSETVAMSIVGVREVTNDIVVEWPTSRSDVEIREDVIASLRWSHLVDDGLIDVQVEDGAVKLTGTVGSVAEKRQARQTAWTAGVMSVDDAGLTVARWARDPDLRTDKYVRRSDADIRKAIHAAFVRDPRVWSFNVMPDVAAGVVTLRGVVDNLKAKRAAEADAWNTVGVVSVINELDVRPAPRRADDAVLADVREAFLRDPAVERFEIDVRVSGGTVYLTGLVDSYYEKAQADDLASRVDGVVAVVNNLRVDVIRPFVYDPMIDPWSVYRFDWRDEIAKPMKDDAEIRKDVEQELFWSPFVDSNAVTVSVDDGVVTLTGTVSSALAKRAAASNAIDGGATRVHNELRIEGA